MPISPANPLTRKETSPETSFKPSIINLNNAANPIPAKTVEAFALYAGAGLWHYNNEMIPHASIAAKIPKNWIILADVGYYDNSVILGGTALYKFTQK